MFVFKLCFLAIVTFTTVKALECWRCENAVSNADCATRGRLETCKSTEDTCQSVLRRENGLTFISKQCKQKQACGNNMKDNAHRCSQGSETSLCTCCCDTDSCNTGLLDCFDQSILRTQSCPVLRSNLPHGNIQCSGEANQPGTVCDFQCTEDKYVVYPDTNSQVECLPTGQWNKPAPCCALPCPPHVIFDVITMVHASNNETYKEIGSVGSLGFRTLITSPVDGNMYAKFEFSGNIHESGRVTFNETLTYPINAEEGVYVNTVDGKVNIGNAMNWALENMVGPGTGNRVRVRDIVLIGTDSASDDDVTEAVQKWLDRGALIYVMIFPTESGEFPQREKMLELTQNPNHLFYFERGNTDSAQKIFDETIKHFCSNICNHVLHDHE